MYHLHMLEHCLVSIPRFALRDKVTLRLLKLYFYMVEWSKVLDISMEWWEFKSCRGRTNICQLKNLILTLLGIYIYMLIVIIAIYQKIKIFQEENYRSLSVIILHCHILL